MELEVIWSGGELLPPRPEGTSPIWRNMLTPAEARVARMYMQSIVNGRTRKRGASTNREWMRKQRKAWGIHIRDPR